MKHTGKTRGIKPLLLCSAAIVTIAWQPALGQERTPMQGGQDRPAATQPQSPSAGQQPSSREDRSRAQDRQRRETTGQNTAPSASDQPADTTTPRANRNRDDARDSQRDAQSPARDRSQSREQSQSRDADTKQQRNQARDRDSDRDQKRNQARDSDQRRDRDSAQSQRDRRDQQRGERNARDRDNARDDSRQDSRQDARSGDRNRQAAQPTERQRTRISTSIRQANVQPVRNVNFSVSVGAVVPTSVRLHPVTPAIVEVYPQYRGYSFVLVEDEIVIVEPRTKKIVTVIEHGGSGRAAAASRSKLSLSEKQRDVIRRSATERRTTTGSGRVTRIEREIDIGDDLPETVEIESFPETVYTEVPEIRSYRYIVRDRDIYLVDPAERRVIDIIR